MSKEVFDLYRNLKTNHGALDLILGLENRSCGKFSKQLRCRESLEFYAEEQFLKKTECEELRCEMPGLPRSTFLMVFSPDGTRVASTHGNHNIYISDVRNGKHIKTLTGHPRTPWCIAFHPTSNQIVASGCLGGQVRIWDLSGGSEVWTAVNQTVIASLAFHPNDRLLAIATYNEVYFWDWSQPEPFVHAATNNPKEKVRYVAFDKLGHKLITGIANTPQTRWERARASVPQPRQERSSGTYRRRITQRLVSVDSGQNIDSRNLPERERRITTCYRNLVREYETLVHRYLQLYRPPTMIDRGTDPMEPTPWYSSSGTQTNEPSTSRGSESRAGPSTSSISSSHIEWGAPGPSSQADPTPAEPVPSTSGGEGISAPGNSRPSPNIIKPSRISSVINKPSTLMRSTQTPEDRKHKNDNNNLQPPTKKHKTTNVRLIKRSVKKMRNAMQERERLLAAGGLNQGPCEFCGTPMPMHNVPAGDTDAAPALTVINATSNGQVPCSEHCTTDVPDRATSSENAAVENNSTQPNSTSDNIINTVSCSQVSGSEHESSNATDISYNRQNPHYEHSGPQADPGNNVPLDSKSCVSADAAHKDSGINSNSSKASTSDAADSQKRTISDCDRADENTSARSHDKYSLEKDCNTKSDNNSTINVPPDDGHEASTSNAGHTNESSSTAKRPSESCGTKPKKAKKPIMVIKIKSTTIDTTYTPTITSTSGLRLRIPLDDNDSNVRATFEHSLLGNTTINVPSTTTSNNTQEGRNSDSNIVQNSVDELLSNIRRTAEEEVRNRILPIIRSVPLNDRPELIRLFENSRESVRMRFRQLYPVFLRKPNRRFPNTPYPTTDSSSSGSEEDRANNNSTSRLSDFSFNPISSPSRLTNRPQNVPRIRNFNTELEDLVTSLLSEIERSENRAGIMTVATSNTNCTVTTTTTGNSTPLLTTVPWPESSRVASRLSDPPSTSQNPTLDNSSIFTPSNSQNSTPENPLEFRPSNFQESSTPDDTVEFGLSNLQTSTPDNSAESRPSNPLLFQECLNIMNSRGILNNLTSSSTITVTTPPVTTSLSFSNCGTNHNSSSSTFLGSSLIDRSILTTPTTDNNPLPSTPASLVNTSTGTTNSTIYTSNTLPRRRFFSHRISAFLPTRVNYTRSPPSSRLRRATNFLSGGRLGFRNQQNSSFALDELINFSERENTEEDPQNAQAESPNAEPPMMDSFNFNNVYSNILNEIGLVLTDIVEIRSGTRAEMSAQQLSTFSDRLEHIENQCESILRNLANSADILGNNSETTRQRQQDNEPTVNFFDPNFYIRDHRDTNSGDSTPNDSLNINDLFNSTVTLRAVSADHTYPRNHEDGQSPTNSDNMNPLMSSVHIIVSHIQRQARFLRERVDLIENMDRMVEEVSQLQLIRRMLIDLTNYIRTRPNNSGDTRNNEESHASGESRNTGMSSVRQMMAGTRISDSSPQELSSEETAGPSGSQQQDSTSANEGTSDSNNVSSNGQTRTRFSNRKTYPPSRLHRLNRHYRRPPSIVHFFSRRYLNRAQRNVQSSNRAEHIRQITQLRTPGSSQESTFNLRESPLSSFSMFNTNSLNTMASRFEQLLTAQMGVFNFPTTATTTTPQQAPRSNVSTDLGEHILSLRLHGCILRMNRIFRDSPSSAIGNYSGDPISPVSRDGVSRFTARQTLSLLVDSASRHLEMCRNNASPQLRQQVQRVLAMAYLLTELLLLTITDSIPSGSSFQWNPPHDVATLRVWHQMLTNRNSHYTHQLSTSWRLMRITMTHAQAALGQSYYLRRRVLIPCQNVDRIQLLGCINRLLKSCKQKSAPASGQEPTTSRLTSSNQPSTSSGSFTSSSNTGWLNTTMRLIGTYRSVDEEDRLDNEQPSTSSLNCSRERIIPIRLSTENSDNSDGDEQTSNSNANSSPSNLYRTNNMNLLQNDPAISLTNTNGSNGTSNLQSRPWNVPSVQVNDVPISEPSTLAQHIMSHRQRFAELRSNPNVGFFRPRFLHPLYASVNPFDDFDEIQRDQIYDSDIITTVTPNHRIQAWDISDWNIPVISNTMKNLVVGECKIHNDASVDVASDGTILVTLLPSGGYLNVTNRLGVYSLRWETLGQCLYTTNFEQNAVSVSLSPLSRHLVVGLASRVLPSERWIMARVFKIDQKDLPGDRLPVVKELEQNRDSRLNCIRWLPNSGQGLIYATNTGQLVILS